MENSSIRASECLLGTSVRLIADVVAVSCRHKYLSQNEHVMVGSGPLCIRQLQVVSFSTFGSCEKMHQSWVMAQILANCTSLVDLLTPTALLDLYCLWGHRHYLHTTMAEKKPAHANGRPTHACHLAGQPVRVATSDGNSSRAV